MTLKQATRLTLVEQVVMQIEAIIESGEWPVGTRIPAEPELVRQLGVSRNTLREAVRALIHVGMLEARQGDGTYVCQSNSLGAALLRRLRKSSLTETLEVRHALEREAARLAALRRTDEDIAALRMCLQRRDDTNGHFAKDTEEYIQADLELHQAIVAATHNYVLIELYGHMSEALRESIGSVAREYAMSHTDPWNHHDLVDAIIAGNPAAAEEAVRVHIAASQATLEND